jgi:hypothetical protein
MIWSYDSLWQKTKVYANRAVLSERNGPLFPFWAVLALELLGRACIARVHPALLADPQEGGGDSLFYACGKIVSPNQPKSIAARTVFERCKKLVESFTGNDQSFCMGLIDLRNRELHTGEIVFEDYPNSIWLARFGDEEAAAAMQMICGDENKLKHQVSLAIKKAKEDFEKLDPATQKSSWLYGDEMTPTLGKRTKCPACSADGVRIGNIVRSNEPKLADGVIVQDHITLPTRFNCSACKLSLDGYNLLQAAEMGGHFVIEQEHDPIVFHSLQPGDFFEEDYGND